MNKKDIPLNSGDEANTKTFSVKVPTWAWQLLNIIAESREHGTNGNDLLKKCLMFVIETAKIDGPVPPEFQTLLNMLKLDTAWHGSFNFADAEARLDIAQIILILQQHDGQQPRKGFGLCMIDKPFMGESKMTFCVDDILERVTEVSMPGLYKELRQVGVSLESQSVRETLTHLCNAAIIEYLRESDAAEGPQLGNFHDFRGSMETVQKYKRKPHLTPDSLCKQQKIIFDDFDRDTGEGEAFGTSTDPADAVEEAIGGKPFDVEP